MKFTFEEYAGLIDCIRENGYTISNYTEYEKYDKAVIIKHDVDMSLSRAAEFAEFEAKLGIKTTYNILICSDFYNPYSKKNMVCIKRIQNAGHDIGLHFDEVRYEDHILDNINYELEILEKLIGVRVKSVSMHRPSAMTLNANFLINRGEIVNTYSEKFFKEFKYISDSRRNWRENPIEILESGNYNKIHILTHPFWYAEQEQSITERLANFLDEAKPERYGYLEENLRDLKSVLQLK